VETVTTAQFVVLVAVGLFVAVLLGFLAWVPWHYHPNEVLHDECAKCAYLRWRSSSSSPSDTP
jgi:hypothetical protein